MLGLAVCALAFTIACESAARESEEREEHGDRKKAARKVSPEMIAKGHGTYKATCAPCHGDLGKGDGPASKIFKPPPQDHTDAKYMDTITDEDMAKTIQMGGALKGKPAMPSHPAIRGEEMTALVAYVRTLSHPMK
jgi:mono/diheme cytochrome c family protein